MQLSASDKDGDTKLVYNIVRVTNNGIRLFELNSRTGKLDIVGPVKTGDHFALTVEVVDSGGKSSQGVIEVRVTPQPNLRGPVFSQFLYEAQISENAAKFATVISTEAKDPEGDIVRYDIVGGNELQHFLIEESTGEIRVNTSLDREQQERYNLNIRASDNGGKTNTATVNVKVLDVNDQTPEFVNVPYSFRVIEGQGGAIVGTVEAEDEDIDENAIVYYSIAEPEQDQEPPPFAIEELLGEIRTTQELDFETQPVYYVVVQAEDKDGLETATATVTVLVQDTSDEIPEFQQSKYKAEVVENQADTLVTTVTAIDKDSEASVTYEIVSGDRNLFKIDSQSGDIITLKGLDFETQRMHFLTISTEEARGTFSLGQTTCVVEISVTDVNDLAPTFSNVPKSVTVRNDAPIGSKIALVKAIDADGTAPGNEVKYELVAEESSDKAYDYFGVDYETGEIAVLADLTKEIYDEYRLEIKAIDQGIPSLEARFQMLIRIQQVVTMAPELGVGFAQLEYDLSVPEDQAVQSIIQSLGLDQVPNPGLKIQCEVLRVKDDKGNIREDQFIGEYHDGQCHLVLVQELDKESDEAFEILLKLKTQSAFTNPTKMIATIKLNLEDVNDNAPEFVYETENYEEKSYLVTISETTNAGSGIIQVKATDQDSGKFGQVSYSITSDSSSGLFKMDANSGIVRTTSNFDSISQDNLPFKLLVTATDAGGQSTTTELFVNLIGADDGIVLVVANTPVDQLELKRANLQNILEDHTGFIVSIGMYDFMNSQ